MVVKILSKLKELDNSSLFFIIFSLFCYALEVLVLGVSCNFPKGSDAWLIVRCIAGFIPVLNIMICSKVSEKFMLVLVLMPYALIAGFF